MRSIRFRLSAPLVISAVLAGCPAGTSGVSAGPDQTAFPCSVVELEGEGEAPVAWTQVSGPAQAAFIDDAALNATVSSPVEGSYVFRITDASGASDEMSVDLYFWVDTGSDTTDAEDGMSSLREAVDAAQACEGSHTVHLEVDAVTLDATLPIGDPLGSDDNDLVIDGVDGRTGVNGVGPLMTLAEVDLSVRAVNIAGVSSNEPGGAVVDVTSPHRLRLEDVDLVDNAAVTGLYGSPIWLGVEGAELELSNVIARDNSSDQDGGVVGADAFVNVTVEGGLFEDNAARWGGAFEVTGDLTIEGATFSGNTADRGGAIHALDGRTALMDCTFDGNTTTALGGAVYMENFGTAVGGTLEISGTTFTGNGGGTSGGAVMIDDEVEASITDSDFVGNTVSDALAQGGAIASGGQLTLSGCSFENNRADGVPGDGLASSGGAIDSGGLTNESFIFATDCRFEGNAAEEGGAVFAVFDAQDDFEACAFTENVADRDGGAMYLSPIGHATLLDTTVASNTASLDGGGVYFTGSNRDSPTNDTNLRLQGSTSISDNTAEFGGGIYSLVGDVVLDGGASVSGNDGTGESSLGVGGGVCNDGGYVEGGDVSGNSPDQVCNEARRL